jgi:dihydroxyacetone kinase-like protein
MNAVNNNREDLNGMDEENHPNHGDNVTHNLSIIKNVLESQQSQSPSDLLRNAAERLSEEGRGSTSPIYAQGLQEAADHFEGQESLSHNGIGLLLHTMLGAAP